MIRHIIIASFAGIAAMPILFSTLALAQAGAQPAPPTAPMESVTVTAPKAANAKPTPFLTGGSRWMTALCPVTIGLVREDNKRVSERIRQVARLVGAPAWTRDGCNPNAEIVFTTEPQAFLDAVAEKHFQLLGNITVSQARDAARVRYPIQSWYSTAMMDDRGGLLLMPPDEDACDPYCFFYLGKDTHIVIGSVVIVVDIDKVQGRKLEAVSDYVALMALTKARAFAKCQPAPSIANLMAPDCAGVMQPDGLTAGDVAWLRDLYHMNPDRARRADAEELASVNAKVGD
jgi:hypothetical protein